MREILFRGKRIDNGEWGYGYYFEAKEHWHDHGKHEAWIAVDSVQNGGWCNVRGKYAVDPETVGQYTGLTDKNGKKIFEGDICQIKSFSYIDETPFVVEWNNEYSGWFWRNLDYSSATDTITPEIAKTAKVIGNIHDNPELLKGGE
jgi:uncharacterized phage protein (TIGR01671 family)